MPLPPLPSVPGHEGPIPHFYDYSQLKTESSSFSKSRHPVSSQPRLKCVFHNLCQDRRLGVGFHGQESGRTAFFPCAYICFAFLARLLVSRVSVTLLAWHLVRHARVTPSFPAGLLRIRHRQMRRLTATPRASTSKDRSAARRNYVERTVLPKKRRQHHRCLLWRRIASLLRSVEAGSDLSSGDLARGLRYFDCGLHCAVRDPRTEIHRGTGPVRKAWQRRLRRAKCPDQRR